MSAYVPMTDDERFAIAQKMRIRMCDASEIEKAVLSRIEAQGLGIVPKADAERVELFNRVLNFNADGKADATEEWENLCDDIRAYLQGGAA